MNSTGWAIVLIVGTTIGVSAGFIIILTGIAGVEGLEPIQKEGEVLFKWRDGSEFHLIVTDGEEESSHEVDDITWFQLEIGETYNWEETPSPSPTLTVVFTGAILIITSLLIFSAGSRYLDSRKRKKLLAEPEEE